MAKHNFKKGDRVDYGPIKDAEVISVKAGNKGDRIEIKSHYGTKFVVEPSEIKKA